MILKQLIDFWIPTKVFLNKYSCLVESLLWKTVGDRFVALTRYSTESICSSSKIHSSNTSNIIRSANSNSSFWICNTRFLLNWSAPPLDIAGKDFGYANKTPWHQRLITNGAKAVKGSCHYTKVHVRLHTHAWINHNIVWATGPITAYSQTQYHIVRCTHTYPVRVAKSITSCDIHLATQIKCFRSCKVRNNRDIHENSSRWNISTLIQHGQYRLPLLPVYPPAPISVDSQESPSGNPFSGSKLPVIIIPYHKFVGE